MRLVGGNAVMLTSWTSIALWGLLLLLKWRKKVVAIHQWPQTLIQDHTWVWVSS